MSNENRALNLVQIVHAVQPQFDELARIHKAVDYKREASFALQTLQDNSYLNSIAMGNQDSLKRAVINVAAIGLSLNPVSKLCYLVPRDKKVILDISYRGFIQLAASVGAIKWAVAELVCANDIYEFKGIGEKPVHEFKPFGDRGKVVGCYCLAKTHGDEFILTQMPIEEIYRIRDRSSSWKAHKEKGTSTVWATDEGEMIKKTVIKRAAKSWPMVDSRTRLDEAIDISNDGDPVDFATEARIARTDREDVIKKMEGYLEDLGKKPEAFLEHLMRVNKRDLKSLSDLTDIELDQAVVSLEQWVEQSQKRRMENENK